MRRQFPPTAADSTRPEPAQDIVFHRPTPVSAEDQDAEERAMSFSEMSFRSRAQPVSEAGIPDDLNVGPQQNNPSDGDADVRTVLENGIREIAGEVRNSLDFHRSQEGGGDLASCSAARRSISPASPRRFRIISASRCAGVRLFAMTHSRRDLRASPCGRSRPHGLGGAPMKAVNLIPADQRGGAARRRAAQGGAYVVPACSTGLGIFTLFYGRRAMK